MSSDISVSSNIITSNYVGVMINGGKNIHITHNTLTGHSQALYINSKIAEIGMQRYIEHNRIKRWHGC